MRIEPSAVPDVWVCTPRVFGDDRGSFLEWFRGDLLAEATGRSFSVVQANHSVSSRGVVRGLHYADVPPGQAKYVYCPLGTVLDVVVDLRVGSPTFGALDAIVLDATDRRGVFISEGIGHAFCVLSEEASVTYLVSTTYSPGVERTISPVDPEVAIPWPDELGDIVLSDKDAAAPTLAVARASGVLPSYEDCIARYAALR